MPPQITSGLQIAASTTAVSDPAAQANSSARPKPQATPERDSNVPAGATEYWIG